MKYSRILLKLSGEAFSGPKSSGIDRETLSTIADEIKNIVDLGIETALVIGGGNFWRGRDAHGYDKVAADSIGMLATIMNGIAFKDVLAQKGVKSRVMSAVEIDRYAEPLIVNKARTALVKGEVVIFSGGTGLPFFSTDTTAVLRALEIQANAVLKATLVDGVYDKDPHIFDDARKYDSISYLEVLKQNLKVMDSTAVSLCMDNSMPLYVFNMNTPGNITKIINGANIGTIVTGG